MKKNSIYLGLLLFVYQNLSAQKNENDARIEIVQKVINGYNHHDYAAMKQPWAGWAKLFVTKKKLETEYSVLFKKYGKATIDTVTFSSKYEYVAKLNMEKDKQTALYFSFIFSERGKIEGFGQTYPPLIYKKCVKIRQINPTEFSNEVDSLFSEKYLKNKIRPFNGSVLVLDNGNPVYKRHFGHADFDLKNNLNDSTIFDLASVSKQFTAMAILILEEGGKLKLTDSISKFLPDFPYKGISIQNLLTHTSGLPEYMDLVKKYWDKSKFASNYDVLEILKNHKPKVQFLPNERFEYCNTGYVLLSIIIEKTSGKSYSEFLKENIFLPLKMSHTRVYNSRRVNSEKIDNSAKGYVYSNEKKQYVLPDSTSQYQEVIYLDAITGDGNINSCLQDLILWENELLYPKILNSVILKKAIANHSLKSGEPINYGHGFFLTGGGISEPLVFHTGGWPGYFCIVMNFFEQKKQIVILSNNSYDDFTRIADDIASVFLY